MGVSPPSDVAVRDAVEDAMLLKHSCCQLVFKTKKNSFVSHLHLMSRWPKPAGVYPRPFTKAFKLGDRRYVDEDHIRIIWNRRS
jgi:hypothetical protein